MATLVPDSVRQTVNRKLSERVSVLDFGAVPDGVIVFDGAINNTSTTFTSASANFTSADIGKTIWIKDAGAPGISYTLSHTQTTTTARDLLTTIASINSPTSVEVADAASATVSNVETRWGTDSTVFIQNAFDEAVTEGFRLYFPRGHYLTTAALTLRSNLSIKGDGWAYKNWETKTPSVIMCCANVTVLQSLEADGDEDGWENGAISEITLRGTDRPGSKGIYSFKTIGLSLFDCGFTRFGDHAVHLDTNGVFGCRVRGLFANECMLVDDRTEYVGIFDFGPSDMFISDCESVGNIEPIAGTNLIGSGKIAALAIRGNNSWVRDCMGALCQIGCYVGPTTTPQAVTTVINLRVDQNEGDGLVVEAFNCNFIGFRAHRNGLGADSTYDGVRILTGSHQFHGCQVTQTPGVDFATVPRERRLRHCFNVDLTVGPAFFPPSVFNMCMVGDAFSGDPTVGYTGNAYNVASGNVNPIILTHEKHIASSQYELTSSLPLNCKTNPIWFTASAGAADTRQWSISADVVGLPNAFSIIAWNDARATFVFPFALYRNQTDGSVEYIRLSQADHILMNDVDDVTIDAPLHIGSGRDIVLTTTTARIYAGSGTPEGTEAAVGGSLKLDGVGKLWIKIAGTGTTGWAIAATFPVDVGDPAEIAATGFSANDFAKWDGSKFVPGVPVPVLSANRPVITNGVGVLISGDIDLTNPAHVTVPGGASAVLVQDGGAVSSIELNNLGAFMTNVPISGVTSLQAALDDLQTQIDALTASLSGKADTGTYSLAIDEATVSSVPSNHAHIGSVDI